MISVDTETSGLYFSHGCQTFAIGIYDGEDVSITSQYINPLTRCRVKEFSDVHKETIRRVFRESNLIAIHNSGFDIKALVEAGVFHKDEPTVPEFWERIIDTTILSHLNHNIDERSLKKLTPQYLDADYESEDELAKLVNKCRLFIRSRRPKWMLANEYAPQLKPSGSSPKWHKSDMWLPEAVAREFSPTELIDYGIDPTACTTLLRKYLGDDCLNTYNLAQVLLQNVIEDYGDDVPKFLAVNNQILHVIYKMEMNGTNIHQQELEDAINTCEEWISKLKKETEELAGVENITDTKLRKILYEDMQLPIEKETKGGAASVDADTIIKLKRQFSSGEYVDAAAEEFLTKIMALKKYDKKLGYLTNFSNSMINNRVHTSYNIVGTDTLRMSAKNPPLQTVSKATNPFDDSFEDINLLLNQSPPLRSVFGPSEGRWWLSCDYNQLQLRIFAVAAGDEDMIEALRQGLDAHEYVARRIFNVSDSQKVSSGQRRIAKNVNFGVLFGASPKKIEAVSGMPGLWNEVQVLFPRVHDFIQEQKETLAEGNPVRTLNGYPLFVPMKEVKWKTTKEAASHAAVCYIVQGTEGSIVKRAMRLCDDYLVSNYSEGRLTMQVHDDITFDLPARFPKKHGTALKLLMEQAGMEHGVYSPVNCEVCTHGWDKGKKVEL